MAPSFLVERDRLDHPDSHPGLPQLGCSICGRTVQPRLDDVAHWDDVDPKERRLYLEEMSRWSREHAAQSHSAAEHAEHQRRLDEASR